MSGKGGRVRVGRDKQGDHALRVQFSVKKQVHFFTLRNLRYTVRYRTSIKIKRGRGGGFMEGECTPEPVMRIRDILVRIRTSGLWIRIRLRILLFPSVQ